MGSGRCIRDRDKGAGSSSSGGAPVGKQVKGEDKGSSSNPKAKPEATLPGISAVVEGGAKGADVTAIPDRYKGTKKKPAEGSSFQCKECQLWIKGMKNVFSEKIWRHYQENKDDAPDAYEVINTCLSCLVKTANMSPGEAMTAIKAQAIRPENSRVERFKAAKAAVRENYEAICSALGKDKLSSKQKRLLTIVDFSRIFSPWAALIALKTQSLEAARGLMDQFTEVNAKLRHMIDSNASSTEIEKTMQEVDALEQSIKTAAELLAFKDRGD